MESVFKICKKLIIKESFYGLFLLNLNKKFDKKIKTAAVGVEGINPVLLINPDFWKGLSEDMQIAILKHEIGHLMYGHLTSNWEYLRKISASTFNKAADCEINSYLPILQTDPYCYPAHWNLENGKGTLYYFDYLKKEDTEDSQTIDDHSIWKNMSDAERELVKQQIDGITKQVSEQVSKNRGTIPGEFKAIVDELFKVKPRLYDWKSYFRKYLGTVIDVELKKSKKKESIRFPDASGIKHRRKSRVFIIVDTSGSIANTDLCDFFSEIHHVYKAGAVIDICEIDTKIQRIYPYSGKWDMTASGRGGTILDDAITHFNNNRREYTSCVIFTDGYCDVDFKIYGDAMWIIASGGKKQPYPGKAIYINNSRQN